MKTEDFDRLKAVCEKEGFEIDCKYPDSGLVFIKKKDIWDGVEFIESIESGKIITTGKIYRILHIDEKWLRIVNDLMEEVSTYKSYFKPSTESAYIEQLKAEAFKRFGEIKEGDRFKLNREIGKISDLFITSWIYRKETDSFGKHGTVLYQQGKWATRVKERVKVSYEVTESIENWINNIDFNVYKKLQGKKAIDKAKVLTLVLEEYLNKE